MLNYIIYIYVDIQLNGSSSESVFEKDLKWKQLHALIFKTTTYKSLRKPINKLANQEEM